MLDLPFLPLANFGVMRKVHDAVYNHPAAQEALGKWNAVIYMSNILPQYEYMGRGKPPQSVADFEGKRLRALGGMGRAERTGPRPPVAQAGHRTSRQSRSAGSGKARRGDARSLLRGRQRIH